MSEGVHLVRMSDGVIVYTNSRFEEMMGYGPGETIGEHISIVNAPLEKSPEEIAGEIIGLIEEQGNWKGEIKNVKKDGTRFWCHASVTAFDHPQHGKVALTVQTDIDAHREARHARTRLLAAIEASPDSMMITNIKGVILDANQAALRLWGAKEEEELTGKNALDLISPDLKESAKASMEEALRTGSTTTEYEVSTKQGESIPMEAKLSLVHNEQGSPLGLITMSRDITERRKATEELDQQRQRLRTLIDSMPDFIYIKDAQSRFITTNKAHLQALGTGLDEVVGKTDFDFFPRELAEKTTPMSKKSSELETHWRA
jgi:PAS domain S-box-containing protein